MRFAASNPQVAKYMAQSPRYDQAANAFSDAQTMESNYVTHGEQIAASAGLDAMGKVRESGELARGIEADGQAAAAGYEAQGMKGLFSGVAGGISKLKIG